jgi:hypothetical protein
VTEATLIDSELDLLPGREPDAEQPLALEPHPLERRRELDDGRDADWLREARL